MIPFIDDVIQSHERGEYPIYLLVAYAVKYLSRDGTQEDFDNLPNWLKDKIREAVITYKKTNGWLIYGSNGFEENYAPYADDLENRFNLHT